MHRIRIKAQAYLEGAGRGQPGLCAVNLAYYSPDFGIEKIAVPT
jgi:hypothetical protein